MKFSPESRAACNENSEAAEPLHRLFQSVFVKHPIDPPVHHRNDDQRKEGRKREAVDDGPTHRLPEHIVITSNVNAWVVLRDQSHKVDVQTNGQRQQP